MLIRFTGPRFLLTQHALSTNIIRQIKDEISQRQITFFTSSDHNSFALFLQQNYIFIIISALLLYNYNNVAFDSYEKMLSIPEYRKLNSQFRLFLFSLATILFRNIENAI